MQHNCPITALQRTEEKASLMANWPCSRTTRNRALNGVLVEGQSLARVKSVLWVALPLTVSCFRKYSDKKNTRKNLKSPAVVFTCNTEHTVLKYCITFAKFRLYRSFVYAVLATALSSTCFEFCWRIFHRELLLHLLDILLTAPPSLSQIDDSRNNPQKSLMQYIAVKYGTISFDSMMSLLRHIHGSTMPRLTALVFGHERFVWRHHSPAEISNCEENLQLPLFTNKIFCGDRQKASLWAKWRYRRSRCS